MLALFLVCSILLLSCFCFVSCFVCTDYKEHCFPCNSSVFSHVGYKVVLYCFNFMFLFLFVSFFCVLFVSILDIWFVLCCVCVVWSSLFKNRTKWFCCLHLVVIFPFCCFVLKFVIFVFFHSSQKRPPKKPDTAKTPKSKNAEKNGQKKSQLAQLCSQIVFFNFLGWASKCHFWLQTL